MIDRDARPGQEPTPEHDTPLIERFTRFVDSMAVVTDSEASDADPLRYGTYWLKHEGPVPYDRAVVELYQFRYDNLIDHETGDDTYLEYRKVIIKDGDVVVHETTLENDTFFFTTNNGSDLDYPTVAEGNQRTRKMLDWLQNGNLIADEETRGAIGWLDHPAQLIHDIAVDILKDNATNALLLVVHDPTYRRLLISQENEDQLGFNLYSRWLPAKDDDMDETVWTRRVRAIQLDTTANIVRFGDVLQFAVHRNASWEIMEHDAHGLDQLSDERSTDEDIRSMLAISYMLRTRSRFSDHIESIGDAANIVATPHPIHDED